MTSEKNPIRLNRRQILGSTAFAAAAGAATMGGALTLSGGTASEAAAQPASGNKYEIKPVNWTNITHSFPADRPAKCVSSACRPCAN